MGEEEKMTMEPRDKELTDYLRRLDQLDTELPPRMPSTKVVHCPCGTGCPECYGKLNCGCPDCYVPEFKRGKKKRVSVDLESVVLLPRLEYSICTVSRVVEEGRATLTKVTKPIVCTQEEPVQRRPGSFALKTRNRWSLPAIPVTIKEKEKEKTRRTREPIDARNVGPPKQVKYFCKKCNLDICNACFSTVCSSHMVQWIGSSFFHCASPHHKIVHEHNIEKSG